ncbi:MOSC domain-containing protein, partial [Bacillus sp. TE8-1]
NGEGINTKERLKMIKEKKLLIHNIVFLLVKAN